MVAQEDKRVELEQIKLAVTGCQSRLMKVKHYLLN